MKKTTNLNAKTILIVDDHPLVCHYLGNLIAANPGQVLYGQANNLADAHQMLDKGSPDLAIIDISLGSGNGLDLIKRIKRRNPLTKTLVFSGHDETLYAPRVLRAGALGYVNKKDDLSHLTEAIEQVLNGKIWLNDAVSEQLLHNLFQDEEVEVPSVSTLSNRELQVFEYIGRGMKTSDIAGQLHLSIKTIETHREKIKKKLRLRSGHELTRYAMQWIIEQG